MVGLAALSVLCVQKFCMSFTKSYQWEFISFLCLWNAGISDLVGYFSYFILCGFNLISFSVCVPKMKARFGWGFLHCWESIAYLLSGITVTVIKMTNLWRVIIFCEIIVMINYLLIVVGFISYYEAMLTAARSLVPVFLEFEKVIYKNYQVCWIDFNTFLFIRFFYESDRVKTKVDECLKVLETIEIILICWVAFPALEQENSWWYSSNIFIYGEDKKDMDTTWEESCHG